MTRKTKAQLTKLILANCPQGIELSITRLGRLSRAELESLYNFSTYLDDSPMREAIQELALEKSPAAIALGKITSDRKAASSRANGALGGRPRKDQQQ